MRALLAGLEKQDLSEPSAIARALRVLNDEGWLAFPLPGAGKTHERFERLSAVSSVDLSLGRLVEGHTDAVAILAEAGGEHARSALYGVWAAEPPGAGLEAEPCNDGWALHGLKRYCSGARALDRALVTAKAPDGARLFDLDVRTGGVVPVLGTWPAIGMRNSDSLDVRVDVHVPSAAAIGAPGFYVARRGFWHGSVGVAACWFGGALGCLEMLKQKASRFDEHAAALFGKVLVDCAAMRTVLERAARDIDGASAEDPEGHARALFARGFVEQACQRVLAATAQASGTSPLVFDDAHARRAADLVVYLTQHHGGRDFAALARLQTAESAF